MESTQNESTQSSQKQKRLLNLPKDVVVLIIQFCNIHCFYRLRLVCRRLKQIIDDNPNCLSQFSTSKPPSVASLLYVLKNGYGFLKKRSSGWHSLEKLDLSSAQSINEDIVETILRNTPNLKILSLPSTLELTKIPIGDILSSELLHLDGTFDESTLQAISKRCRKLTHLVVRSHQLTQPSSKIQFASLQYLSIVFLGYYKEPGFAESYASQFVTSPEFELKLAEFSKLTIDRIDHLQLRAQLQTYRKINWIGVDSTFFSKFSVWVEAVKKFEVRKSPLKIIEMQEPNLS